MADNMADNMTNNKMTLISVVISSKGEVSGPSKAAIETVTKDGKGHYIIVFNTPFTTPPVVVATPYSSDNSHDQANFLDPGSDTRGNVVIVAVEPQAVKIKTGNASGAAMDRKFSLTALGELATA